MPILPVLDLMKGQIVRGIGGRRETYQPIVSKLVGSTAPLAVARAIRDHFGINELYLADLDAIVDGRPGLAVYQALQSDGFKLWIDAGIKTSNDIILRILVVANVPGIIVGLESLAGPDELPRIVTRVGSERVVFSLDLKEGKPLGQVAAWGTDDAWDIAKRAISTGVRRLIVLDLARVGIGQGVGTEALCERIKAAHPAVQVAAGGGVRSVADVRALEAAGVERVLVASALHDGVITRSNLAS